MEIQTHHDSGQEPATVGARDIDTAAGTHSMILSNQWFARPDDQRFLSLTEARDFTKARYDSSVELVLPNRSIEFIAPPAQSMADTRKLSIGIENDGQALELNPTNWSFGQVASLAGAPADYLRRQPTQHVADCLTWDLRRNREVAQVKTYSGKQNGADIYAFTGPKYGRIPDYEVFEALMEIAGEGTGDRPWKVPGKFTGRWGRYDPNHPVTKDTTTIYASDRDMFVFLCDDRHPIEIGKLPNGEPDYLFRGFYVRQSEVGAAALELCAMYLRGVCCNRILWGVEKMETFRIVHQSQAPDRFVAEALPALRSFTHGSTDSLLEGVEAAKAAQVATEDAEAVAWLNDRGLSRKRAAQVLQRHQDEEGRPARTVWDMAQALTAEARENRHADQRLALEQMAGKALDKVAA